MIDLLKLQDKSRANIHDIRGKQDIVELPLSQILGHSGASIKTAIIKDGPLEAMEAEALHLDYLGPGVAPRVYMFGQNPDGTGRIVMEVLEQKAAPYLLLKAVVLLFQQVFRRFVHPKWPVYNWEEQFYLRFGFEVPTWVNEDFCCIHGDPTLANIRYDGKNVRLIDPKPPGNGIPPMPGVDMGKIMQSWMGWERALFWKAGRVVCDPVDRMYYAPPSYIQENPFEEYPEEDLRRAMFWCMVHFLRIVHREGRTDLGKWASLNVRNLQEAVGMEHVTISLGSRWDSGVDSPSQLPRLQIVRD